MIQFLTFWSEEDGEYIGVCNRYPSLSHTAETAEEAEFGIVELVRLVEEELRLEET